MQWYPFVGQSPNLPGNRRVGYLIVFGQEKGFAENDGSDGR
ncbi:MAG: hypothetical protein WAM60_19915 [Candidatus Promineifilaceae bacterium]